MGSRLPKPFPGLIFLVPPLSYLPSAPFDNVVHKDVLWYVLIALSLVSSHSWRPNHFAVRLGNSGLKVSRIILGCMSYGDPKWQGWVLEEEEAIKHIKYAYVTPSGFCIAVSPSRTYRPVRS